MLNESNKKVILKIIGAAVIVFILVYLAITIIGPGEGSLDDVIKDINVNTVPHPMGHVFVSPDLNDFLNEDLA